MASITKMLVEAKEASIVDDGVILSCANGIKIGQQLLNIQKALLKVFKSPAGRLIDNAN